MGDDTWMQIAPWAFAAGAHPFPSFNVLDLHTVDQGVMQVSAHTAAQGSATEQHCMAAGSGSKQRVYHYHRQSLCLCR